MQSWGVVRDEKPWLKCTITDPDTGAETVVSARFGTINTDTAQDVYLDETAVFFPSGSNVVWGLYRDFFLIAKTLAHVDTLDVDKD